MDNIDSVKVNGLPIDEWNAIENHRQFLEWAVERTPQHATTDEVLAAAERFARFVYGDEVERGLDANAALRASDAERNVVKLHNAVEEPENEKARYRWDAETGFVAFSTVQANGAVVSFSLDYSGRPCLTVSIGGQDIKAPIPPSAMLEISNVFAGQGGNTCA